MSKDGRRFRTTGTAPEGEDTGPDGFVWSKRVCVAKSDAVTDMYLADLPSRRGMTLATLDTGVAHPAVEVL